MATKKSPALNTAIGSAIDTVFADLPELKSFSKGRVSGSDVRSYLSETPWAQCQIFFYRDKWWTSDGGTLYGECYYLVNELQRLLTGQEQSLANLDYKIPSHHLQWALDRGEDQVRAGDRQWEIRNLDDVTQFESRLRTLLPEVILPWAAQFDSIEAIVKRLYAQQKRFALAELLAKLGRWQEADEAMIDFLTNAGRFTRLQLTRLRDAGLVNAQDVDTLTPAGDMRGDARLEIVKPWIAARRSVAN